MAIGTDIEFVFVQKFVKKGTIYAVSSNGYAHMRSLRNKHIIDLDKIKLCPDYRLLSSISNALIVPSEALPRFSGRISEASIPNLR